MARWESNAQGRLEQAALDLYSERGYEATTIGEIAERGGVTSRTYFRYFPDKREVLFGGSSELQNRIVRAITDAPSTLPPLAAVLEGIGAAQEVFRTREHLRRREKIVASARELQEREAMKLASIASDLATVLIERGVDEASARMAADAGVAVFKEAARLWMSDEQTPYPDLVERAARTLDLLVSTRDGSPDPSAAVIA